METFLIRRDLINILKKHRDNLILQKINYRLLKRRNEDDREILREIEKFDNQRFCFGDYNILDVCMQYINFGIFYDKELIGYFGFCYHSDEIDDTFLITILLKEKYRNCKIGDVVLKQMLCYIFENYEYINNIYASVLISNISSRKLMNNNYFDEIESDNNLFLSDSFFSVNGVLKEIKQYVFKREQYNIKKKLYKKFSNISICYD